LRPERRVDISVLLVVSNVKVRMEAPNSIPILSLLDLLSESFTLPCSVLGYRNAPETLEVYSYFHVGCFSGCVYTTLLYVYLAVKSTNGAWMLPISISLRRYNCADV